jgi:hypothetical protein
MTSSDVSAQNEPKPQGGRPEGGIRAAACELGVDRSKARRARKRVEGIAPEIRDRIRMMRAIKGVDLDALAKTPPEQQAAALDAVQSGEAKNVREALARLQADGLKASFSPSPSSTTAPQSSLPFSEPPAPTQRAVKDLQGEESKARPSPIPGEAEPRKPETNVTTEGATAPPVSPLEPEPSGSLEPPKPSATSAAPPQTAATEGEGEDSPINDLTMHTMCIPLEPIAQTWDDERVATAVSRLSHAAWCAPDAPEAGTGDPAAAAAQTIAELVAWTHRLQKGRTGA